MNDIEAVMQDVAKERRRQDEQWGGPEHDDRHEFEDWDQIFFGRLDHCNDAVYANDTKEEYRRAVQLAAVAVAYAEAVRRRIEKSG